MIRHKIGGARTIQTAVLVCEYLRSRLIGKIHPDCIHYAFHEPTAANGNWSADIIVDATETDMTLEVSHEFCETCRAFVAGRGEVW